MEIQTKGFELLSQGEKNDFDALFSKYSQRIERKLKGMSSVVMHLKGYNRDGKRKKFSIHSRFVYSGRVFEANAFDWDFKKAVHKIFTKMENEIEHKFHLLGKRKR